MSPRPTPTDLARRLSAATVLVGALLVGAPATAMAVTGPVGDHVTVLAVAGVGPGDVVTPTIEEPTPTVGDGGEDGGGLVIVPDVPEVPEVPSITLEFGEDGPLSQTVVVLVLLTLGAVVPGLLLLMTSFTRFVVVLGLMKNALGLQTVPPSQVLVGLALFLSLFAMGPTISQVNEVAVQPYLAGEIEQGDAFRAGFEPLRDFMLSQTREEDLQLFVDLSGQEQPASVDDVTPSTLVPAFVISELRAAFIMGFMIFIPFLILDLLVAAVLMSMGMMMLPPVFISLPLKLLLFVLVDGWALIAGSLVRSVTG